MSRWRFAPLVPLGVLAGVVAKASAQTPAPAAAPAAEPVTAFVDVSVVPMDRERVLAGQTVVVRGDRITALGPVAKVRVPEEAARIDGRGKFLIPGLADMHVAHSSASDAVMLLLLANGITTARFLGDLEKIGPAVARARVARGELIVPRIYATINADRCYQERADSLTIRAKELATCFAAKKAAGYDAIKVGGDRTALFDTIVKATKLAQLPVLGHVPSNADIGPALQAPYRSIEHLYGYLEYALGIRRGKNVSMFVPSGALWLRAGYQLDSLKLREIAAATKRAGTWNVPTQAIWERMWLGVKPPDTTTAAPDSVKRRRPFNLNAFIERWLLSGSFQGDTAQVANRLALNFQILRALHAAGAPLLAGTDGGVPGFLIHRELALFVKAGLTPYEALATATRNVATFLGTAKRAGTIAAGKQADLVLLDGNPLEDIGYTAGAAGVMARGRWLPRAELDARLDSLASYQGQSLKEERRRVWRHRGVLAQ